MIYVTSDIDHPFFTAFKNVQEARLEPDSIYWHDKHDRLRDIPFADFLEDKHWNHLRADPTSKILLFYGDEYFNLEDLEMYADTIIKQRINPSQIFLIVLNLSWKNWATLEFKKRGVTDLNITDYDLLLKQTTGRVLMKNSNDSFLNAIKSLITVPALRVKNPKIEKKFSAFSRRYDNFRLSLFAELQHRNLLKNFKYTFNNIDPYADNRKFEVEEILETLSSKGYVSDNIKEWVIKIPYTFPTGTVNNKWSNMANKWIEQTGIHLLVESHFEPFNHFSHWQDKVRPRDFAPSLITEKTWKVISSARPFIVFSTPHFLNDLRELGYKTFHPYINESYDLIENSDDRLTAIIDEIQRLDNLSKDEFDFVFAKCYTIAQENLIVFEQSKKRLHFKDEFLWINKYLHTLLTLFKKEQL